MDLRAGRKPHVSVPSLPAAGTGRPPRPARRFPAPGRRGPRETRPQSCLLPRPGQPRSLPGGDFPAAPRIPEAGNSGRRAAPPSARPAAAAGRPASPPPAPGRRPNGRGGAGGPAAPSRPPQPRRSPHRGCRPPRAWHAKARRGSRRRRRAPEKEARGPLSGVTLAPRSPLLRINKIFKMAVREGKRECGGQSGPRAGSWRARVGEAGRPGASAGSPGRGGAARGRPGRGRRGGALRGRRGCEAWLVGSLRGKRAGRVPSGRPAPGLAGLIARTLGGLPGYCLLGSFPEKGGSLRPGGGGRLVAEKFPSQEVAT